MIHRVDFRDKGAGTKNQGESFQTPAEAVRSMVVFELGYGGCVTDLSLTKVVVETDIYGTKDTTILEGTKEEMEFIVKVARAYKLPETSEGDIFPRLQRGRVPQAPCLSFFYTQS